MASIAGTVLARVGYPAVRKVTKALLEERSSRGESGGAKNVEESRRYEKKMFQVQSEHTVEMRVTIVADNPVVNAMRIRSIESGDSMRCSAVPCDGT